jgi:hypothetical protein
MPVVLLKSIHSKYGARQNITNFRYAIAQDALLRESTKWMADKYERTEGTTMSSELKFEVTYLDTETNLLASIKGKDFADQLDKLKLAVEHMVKKMGKVGDYELSEITAKAGVELGAWVFKADGSIEMKWTKPKKAQARLRKK